MKKIAILCSGGDAPGMNSCIFGCVKLLLESKHKVVGVIRGFEGLLKEEFVNLNKSFLSNFQNNGGCDIKTSRCNEMFEDKCIKKAVDIFNKHKFDCLIVLGGNGSLKAVQKLAKLGVNILFIPSTIDNDLKYTSNSLGFDTAVNNAVDAIEKIKATMFANDRGAVVEVMGRESGYIALHSAIATSANYLIIKEKKFDLNDLIKKINQLETNGILNPLVVVAENVLDTEHLVEKLQIKCGKEFKYCKLGYIQRGGAPTIADKVLAYQWAVQINDLINSNSYNKAVGVFASSVIEIPLDEVDNNQICFNQELYDMYIKLNK